MDRMVYGRLQLDEHGVLYHDGQAETGDVYNFTAYRARSDDHICTVMNDGSIRRVVVQPPHPSIFAIKTNQIMCSVSNEGCLSYRSVYSDDWSWTGVETHGVVHEIGVIDTMGTGKVVVIFYKQGEMELRELYYEYPIVMVSPVMTTGVYSISSLHRPRYIRHRAKSAQTITY